MGDEGQYLSDFMRVFSSLERGAPGSTNDSLKALSFVPIPPTKILEIGCGKGHATIALAQNCDASIIATDNEPSALASLEQNLQQNDGLPSRVSTACMDMAKLSFSDASFDLIWSEGSAYIMGVQNALKQWKRLLTKNGVLVVSDLVWTTDHPSAVNKDFWHNEYPDMQTVETRLNQATTAGYEILANYPYSPEAFENYYLPLESRVKQLKPEMKNSTALEDIIKEIEIYKNYKNEFGYDMFVLQPKP